MRAEVVQITFNSQNSIVLSRDFLCASKAPKFTETFTSELNLDMGYFDRFYGTFIL